MEPKIELKTGGEIAATDTAVVESIVAGGSAKANLLRVLTPEFQGLNPSDFMDLTQAAINAASPDRLRTRLIDVRPDGRVLGHQCS